MSTPPPFLKKLFALVGEIDPTIASWDEPGTSFIVHRPIDFQEVLKNYFKGTQQTFIRQLHFYGFSKTDLHQPDAAWAFAHPKFHRDNIDALFQIQRKTNKGATLAAMRSASATPSPPPQSVNHYQNQHMLPPAPLPAPSHSSSVSSTNSGYQPSYPSHNHHPSPPPPSSSRYHHHHQSYDPNAYVPMSEYSILQDQVISLQEQLRQVMAFVGMSQSSYPPPPHKSSNMYGSGNHHSYGPSHHHHHHTTGHDTRQSSHASHSSSRGRGSHSMHRNSSHDHGSHGNSNNKHDIHHDDTNTHGRPNKKSKGLHANDADLGHSMRSHVKSPSSLGDYVSDIQLPSSRRDSFKVASSPMSRGEFDLTQGFFFDDASSIGSLSADDLMHELEIGVDSKRNEDNANHDTGSVGSNGTHHHSLSGSSHYQHHHHLNHYNSNGSGNGQDSHEMSPNLTHHHTNLPEFFKLDPDHELPPDLDVNLVKQVFVIIVKLKLEARKKNTSTALSTMLRSLPDPATLPEIHEDSPVTDRMETEVIPQVKQVAPHASITKIRKAIRHCYCIFYKKYVEMGKPKYSNELCGGDCNF